jgi:signal transduction histidine kinase
MNLISQLERQVDLQERMVNDLLDFARMEKGRLSIQPEMCAIDSLLREEVKKSQMEAQEREVVLTLALPENRPFPLIAADQDRIRQVIWNLIHNSLKFTPEQGRIVVRGQFDEENVIIEVADTGIGLSPETQERIFDKFFQITPGGSKGARGLGLGLAICKEIVLAHRGKIRAHSAGLGQGSTMSFTLPIRSPLLKSPGNAMPALSTETISQNAA